MIGLKRFMRPGIVISVVAHVGAFAVGLISFAGSMPQAVPPEAMEVEIVTPTEDAPRLQGTPSPERTSGTEAPFKANHGNDAAQQQPVKPDNQPAQKPQQHANPQKDAGREKAKPEKPLPKLAHADAAPPEMEQERTTESLPAPPDPHPDETQDQPSAAEAMAELALAGGRFGGGFNAPPVETRRAGYDFTMEFRERVSSCSSLPEGMSAGEKISVVMRVFLNRDGTLASQPQLLTPITSAKQQVLMQNSINALQQCQPYTMLPPEKYNQWKKLDLTFYPVR
jgi:hypothetical protein